MRSKATRVDAGPDLLDTCGTGGSGLSTTNTSTIAAFILAAAGVKIAKHGNRASSGQCGSMDVLEKLGVPIELGPEAVSTLLDQCGIAFMFAPRFHPALANVGPIRREVGFRTTFNFLELDFGRFGGFARIYVTIFHLNALGAAPSASLLAHLEANTATAWSHVYCRF